MPAEAAECAHSGTNVVITVSCNMSSGSYTFTGTLTINPSVTVTVGNTTGDEASVTITADNIRIDGTLTATGHGYAAVNGPGGGTVYGGGGHAGNGGNSTSGGGGGTYGDPAQPTTLGSGSGYTSGAAGGGAIKLVSAGTILVNGTVSADGNSTSNYGGGAGGSVWISAGTFDLTGTGSITASGGGVNATGGSGGGGGGRIAIYATTDSSTGTSVSAWGGTYGGTTTQSGGAGTVFKKLDSQTYGDLTVDANSRTNPANTTQTSSTSQTYDSVTIKNGTNYVIPNGSSLTVNSGGTFSTSGNTNSISINNGGTFTPPSSSLTLSGLNITNAGSLAVVTSLTLNGGNTFTEVSGGTYVAGLTSLTLNNYSTYTHVTGYTGLDLSNLTIPAGTTFNQNSNDYNPLGSSVGALDVSGTFRSGALARVFVDTLTVNSGGVVTSATNSTTALGKLYQVDISATTSIEVKSGGNVNVDGKGYAAGTVISTSGQGPGGGTVSNWGGGGGHAGRGGDTGTTVDNRGGGGATYGEPTQPTDIGSGGAYKDGGGGNGGGAIHLATAGTLTVVGTVSANGFSIPVSNNCGGGAGGSVWLEAATLTGGGAITANGGSENNSQGGGGGGGGRVATYATTTDDATGTRTAYGGAGGNYSSYGLIVEDGGAGTVYRKTPGQTYGDLVVDGNNLATVADTEQGHGGNQTYDNITIRNGARYATLPTNGLVLNSGGAFTGGGTVQPSLTVREVSTFTPPTSSFTFSNIDVSASGTIETVTDLTMRYGTFTEVSGGSFSAGVTSLTLNYATYNHATGFTGLNVTSLTVPAGSTFNQNSNDYYVFDPSFGALTVSGTFRSGALARVFVDTLTVNSGGVVTSATNSTTTLGKLYQVDISATTSIEVKSGGTVNVDGKGYAAGVSAASPNGNGPGGGTVSSYGGGGGYGGRGGNTGASSPTGGGGVVYGSVTQPTDLGSGGAYSSGSVGNAGGAIHLATAGTLTVAGTISANGFVVTGGNNGGGNSGGSVWLEAGTLTGSGAISANGGDASAAQAGGGGGGGRVATYATTLDNAAGARTAYGGAGGTYGTPDYASDAGAGTVYRFVSGSSTYGDLIVDNNNIDAGVNTEQASGGNQTYDNITIRNGAKYVITIYKGLTLATGTTLTGGGTVQPTLTINAGGTFTGPASTTFNDIDVTAAGTVASITGLGMITGTFTESGTGTFSAGGGITYLNLNASIYNHVRGYSGLNLPNLTVPAGSTFNNADSDYYPFAPGFGNLIVYGTYNSQTLTRLYVDNLIVGNGGVVTHQVNPTNSSTKTYQLDVSATTSIYVYAGGSVNANAKGFFSNTQNGIGPGAGLYTASCVGGGGAGYGGNGGNGVSANTGGATYGSVTVPTDLGSSAGGSCNYAGYAAGGGAVRLITAGTLTNAGTIASIGGAGGYYTGAGSGGSVWITADTFTGGGSVAATGGAGSSGGAGGGGRVAIYATTTDSSTGTVTAYGGVGGGAATPTNGGAGTVYRFASTAGGQSCGTNGCLVVDDNNLATAANTTQVCASPQGCAQTYDNITVKNGSKYVVANSTSLTLVPGGSFTAGGSTTPYFTINNGGTYYPPSASPTFSSVVVTNAGTFATATGLYMISGTFTESGTGTFSAGVTYLNLNASTYNHIRGYSGLNLPNLTVPAGSTFNNADSDYYPFAPGFGDLVVYGTYNSQTLTRLYVDNLVVQSGGVVTHQASGSTSTKLYQLDVSATTSIYVYAGGYIHTNGKGFSGHYSSGGWYGYGTGGGRDDNYNQGGGAGYGGKGGDCNTTYFGGGTYGSTTQPTDIGSGTWGGAGGGAIHLITPGTMTVAGTVSASGTFGGGYGGAGSGGSVYLEVGTLTGGGVVSANGAPITGLGCGGAGGGRVAVYATTDSSTGTVQVPQARGASGNGSANSSGGAGTVYKMIGSAVNGDLYIDNFNLANANITAQATSTNQTYDNVTIKNASYYVITSGASLTVAAGGSVLGGGTARPYITVNPGGAFHLPPTTSLNVINLTNNGTLDTVTDLTLTMSNFIQSQVTSLNSLTLNSGGQFTSNTAGVHSIGTLVVNSGGVMTHTANTNYKAYNLDLSTSTVNVAVGGLIHANSAGYSSGYIIGGGAGATGTGATTGGGGGGHGGWGGWGTGTVLGAGAGGTYNDATSTPVLFGSGGGSGNNTTGNGGRGGGQIHLVVSTSATVNGIISASGTTATASNSGGGAGGSVWIDATTGYITGSGSIRADGGGGNGSYGGCGAGGRIAINFATGGFTGTTAANGACAGVAMRAGENGSIYTENVVAVSVSSPNGGGTYYGNAPISISWTSSGIISHYAVVYSTDSGATWSTTATDNVATSPLSWSWPNVSTTQGRIRVYAMDGFNNVLAQDDSDTDFTVVANSVTVTSPNGGESYSGGMPTSVTWDASGNPHHFAILYSTDSGATFSATATASDSASPYSWTLPNVGSTTMRVRIKSLDASNNVLAQDDSDADFTIIQTAVTLNVPNGGESYSGYEQTNITWSATGTVAKYRLSLSTNGGSTWPTILTSSGTGTSYAWTVGNATSTSQARVKIEALDPSNTVITSDTSDANFTITPVTVTVTAPNGGQSLTANQSYDITWNHTGTTIDHYQIKLSTNGGSSYDTMVATTTPASPYNWTVPDISAASAKIRVQAMDASDTVLATDVSDTTFSIEVTSVTVTAPNGGGNYSGYSTQSVTWTSLGTIHHFRISLSTDGGSTFPTILSASATSPYSWVVGNATSTSQGRIQVEALDSGNNVLASDMSDSDFTITPVSVTVTAPNGGGSYDGGMPTSVTWDHTGTVDHYAIVYSTNSGVTWSATATASDSASPYSWTVPNISSTTMRVRIMALNASSQWLAADDSDADFTVVQTTVTVTDPNGTESVPGGAAYNISWNHTGGADHYRLKLSTNSGSTYPTTIVSSTPSSPYSWIASNIDSSTARVQVEALDPSNNVIATDASDADFTLVQTSVSVTSPNGGEWYTPDYSYDVTWNATGTVNHYRVLLSTDGGSTYPTILTNSATSSPYGWTVSSATNTSQARVKVEARDASENLMASDASNADFVIGAAYVTISAPNGGESLAGGAHKTVTWSANGPVANYRISFSSDNGSTTSTVATVSSSTSTYDWVVNNVTTSQGLIQVEALDAGGNTLASDFSDAVFSVTQTTITLTAPNGGGSYNGGDFTNITWSSSGLIDHYRLKLSTNSGSTYPTTITSSATASPYGWTINNVSTSQGRIQVEAIDAAGTALASDSSDSDFTIVQSTVTVTAPNGGQTLYGYQSYTVTWNQTGYADHYRVSLSTNAGSTFPTILTSSSTGSPYAWTVGNTTSTSQARIKVEALDASNSVVTSDTSDANFTITTITVAVTAPNGGNSLVGGQSYNITWNQTGNADHYRVSLSTNGGSSYPTVLSASATSPYAWSVNNISTTQGRIKVEALDAYDTVLASDASDSNFTITPVSVTVTAPNGGGTYNGGYVYSVTWSHSGATFDHYRVSLSTDGGSTFPTILSASATSPYSWTVGNATSTSQGRIQVEGLDAYDNLIASDASDANFTIVPTTVTVTDPNGGDTLYGTYNHVVYWSHSGTIDHYAVKLSTDSGVTFPTTLSPNVANSPSAWIVSNISTTTARIRIEAQDASNNVLAYDDSDSDFTIIPTGAEITAPNGGEYFKTGSSYTISWTANGQIDHFALGLSTDGGSTWPVSISSNATSPFLWKVPSGVGTTQARVRVQALDSGDAVHATSYSAANFTILQTAVTLTAPTGGENFSGYEHTNVTWSATGTIDHYRVLLSTDGGANIATTLSASATSPYDWAVSNATGTSQARIIVEDLNSDGEVVASATSSNFTITPVSVTITAPLGGASLDGGAIQNITWNHTGTTIDHYRVLLSTDGGSSYGTTLVESTTASSYAWTIPNSTVTQYRVKVEALDASNVVLSYDSSTSNVTATETTVTLTAPNGGQTLDGGQIYNVTWSETGGGDHYRVSLSTDGGSTYPTVVTSSATSSPYAWTVPNFDYATARLKIETLNAVETVVASDTSDADFAVVQTTVTVTAPNGGQSLSGYQSYNVTWTHTGGAHHYRVLLSTDGGSTFPTTVSASASSPYDWTVNNVSTSQGRIKVEALNAADAVVTSDLSDANFTITPTSVTVTAPNGGQNFSGYQSTSVTWSHSGSNIDHYRVSLSTDGGSTYPTILTSSISDSPYAWTVGNATGTSQARIKVEGLDALGSVIATDVSDANFTITQVTVTVTAPNGGQNFSGYESTNVTWTSTGTTVDHYRISLSTDGGSTFPTVLSASTTSPYGWAVSNATGTSQARIKIEALDASNAVLASDMSDSNFTITQVTVTVTAPNGGGSYNTLQTYSVTWNHTGTTVDHYAIQFSSDSGSTFPTTLSASATSPWDWTVSGTSTTTARIRVQALNASNVVLAQDTSNSDFTIVETTVTVTAPNGGQSLNGGQVYNVTWNHTGAADHYAVVYSTDSGATWSATATANTSGSPYAWTLPNTSSSTMRVRVMVLDSSSQELVSDTSDADFTITQTTVTVTAPNGGQSLDGFQSYSITWTHTGGADHYRLKLSTDGGSTFPTTITSSATGSPYSWTVNNVATSQARIQVEAMNSSDVAINSDASDADFTINQSTVTVTAPNGGQSLDGGQVYSIAWSQTGYADHYAIQLSTDGGATFPTTIASSATGSPYSWTVNNVSTSQARIRVQSRDASDAVLTSDISDSNFTIAAVSVTVTAPNGGQDLLGGEFSNITWSHGGNIDHYAIQLSTDSGSTWPITITSSATGSPYGWNANLVTTTHARIRVQAVNSEGTVITSDASDADFSITSVSVTLTSLDGGQTVYGTYDQSVTWSSFGAIDHFRVLLSTDGGSTFPTTLSASATSPYTWAVSNATSTATARIRVQGLSAGNDVVAEDTSAADFNIIPTTVTLTSMDSGTYVIGAAYNITWGHTGAVDHYQIKLSTDGGATYPTMVATSTSGSPYLWTVPSVSPTSQARIRVQMLDASDSVHATDYSAANLSLVQTSVDITTPAGGEALLAGGQYDVIWTGTNAPDRFRLSLSTDGGATYPIVAANSITSSPYHWTVNNQPTGTGRLRLEAVDAFDNVVASDVSGSFTISGQGAPTTSNSLPLSRIQKGVVATFSLNFEISHVVSSQLVVTFPSGFELLSVPTSGSSCLSNFVISPDHRQLSADKSNCPVGTITMSGGTVQNPSASGIYVISWYNDEPGSTKVPIIDSDQFLVSARVESSLTFDVGAQAAAVGCDGTFSGSGGSVDLGSITSSSVASSDSSSVKHICTRLTTNAPSGATVSVRSLNAALKSTSAPTHLISSASTTLAAGTTGYGLCGGSNSGDTGWDSAVPGSYGPVRSTPFAGSCTTSNHQVGALTTGDQTVWTVSGPTQNAYTRLYLKAAVSSTVPAHSDYADTLTFIATGTY